MGKLMRCLYCGLLQDEPAGAKTCLRCGGELAFEDQRIKGQPSAYITAQLELDQIYAPAGAPVDRYLLLTIKTPAQVPPAYQPPKGKKRPPVNFNPVLDISGSMHGAKLEFAKQAILQALKYLSEGDAFSLVTYNSQVACPFEPQEVDVKSIREVEQAVKKIRSGSMTALHDGLQLGTQKAAVLKREANLVLLLSDGLANVGITDLELVGQVAAQAHKVGQTVSAIGVGLDYNEALLTEIAGQGDGRFYHLEHPNQIPAFIAGELGEAANWAAKALKLHLQLPKGASVIPLSSLYQLQQDAQKAVVTIGDLPCDTELEVALRLSLLPQLEGAKGTVAGELSFTSPNGKDLTAALNPVTVRFVDSAAFLQRQGVVEVVVLKVLQHWKDLSLLNLKRAMFTRSLDERAERERSLNSIREYASRLGEGRAMRELRDLEHQYGHLYGPSHLSKQAVYDSYARSRGQKDFWKKKK